MKYHWPGNVRELENMVRRMVVLGNEQAVLEEIASGKATPRADPEEEPRDFLDLEALGADFSNGDGMDLKAISRDVPLNCREKGDRAGAPTDALEPQGSRRALQISYKALLYKMKENGL